LFHQIKTEEEEEEEEEEEDEVEIWRRRRKIERRNILKSTFMKFKLQKKKKLPKRSII